MEMRKKKEKKESRNGPLQIPNDKHEYFGASSGTTSPSNDIG
jgi:hypothetical protein